MAELFGHGAEISHFEISEKGLDEQMISELIALWQEIFQTGYSSFRPVLFGEECISNRDIIFVARQDGKIIGTSHLTISITNPELGGLGEVCTLPESRGMGLATRLCKMALDQFVGSGGKALFLGTSNPVAARIYTNLGWQKIPGSNVMVYLTDNIPADNYLQIYFAVGDRINVLSGSASDRIPVIPLILFPHEWHVLDSNIGLYSTRFSLQRSCMGLYPRYQSMRSDYDGNWLVARNGINQVTGLISYRIDKLKRCYIDGFMHPGYLGHWGFFIDEAMSLAAEHGASSFLANLSSYDNEKIALFKSSSFRLTGEIYQSIIDNHEISFRIWRKQR